MESRFDNYVGGTLAGDCTASNATRAKARTRTSIKTPSRVVATEELSPLKDTFRHSIQQPIENPVIRRSKRRDLSVTEPTMIVRIPRPSPTRLISRHELDTSHILQDDTLILSDADDGRTFLYLANCADFDLSIIRYLVIRLNASQHDELTDDYLAMALSIFHADPEIPKSHDLEMLSIILRGNILFTRHNYTLVSPAASGEVSGKLHKLIAGGLKSNEKANLGYKVNITEKSISKALLGIRGVQNIVIKNVGRAQMESRFQEALETCLVLPVGVSCGAERYMAPESDLYRLGEVCSLGRVVRYETREYDHLRRNVGKEKGKLPILLNQRKTVSTAPGFDEDHVVKKAVEKGTPEKGRVYDEAMDLFYTPQVPTRILSPGRPKQEDIPSGFRNLRRHDSSDAVDDESKEGEEHEEGKKEEGLSLDGRSIHDMVQILTRPQDNDDLLLPKDAVPVEQLTQELPQGIVTKHGEWLVLTGKGNCKQLGWKV